MFKSGLKDTEAQARRFAGAMGNIGRQAGGAFLAIGASIAVPLKIFHDFERQMSRVQAISGATDEQFKKMTATARDLGATTIFSASEAASGMQFLAQAGLDASEIVQAMPGVLDIAAASQIGLAEAADITTNVMAQFRIEAKNASTVGDILTKTANSSNVSFMQLSESFKLVGGTAASLGVPLNDTATLLGKLGDAGIQGSMGGTTLSRALQDLANPSKEASAALQQLGVKVFDAAGNMRPIIDILEDLEAGVKPLTAESRNNILSKIFEQRSLRAINVLLLQGTQSIRDLNAEVNNFAGTAANVAAKQSDTLFGSLKRLRSIAEEFAISIGTELSPVIRDISNVLVNFISALNAIPAPIKKVIAVTALVLTGLTGLVAVVALSAAGIAGLVANVAGLITALGGWAAVSGSLLTALTATGTFLLTRFIPALVIIQSTLFLVQNNVLGLGDAVRWLGEKFSLTGNLMHDFNVASSVVAQVFDEITSNVEKLIVRIGGLITTLKVLAQFGGTNQFDAVLESAVKTTNMKIDAIDAKFNARQRERIARVAAGIGAKPRSASSSDTGLGNVLGRSGDQTINAGGDAAAATAIQKAQMDALRVINDQLTSSLRATGQAAEQTALNLGGYAQKADLLALSVTKITHERENLVATEKRLSEIKFTGDAEAQRVKALEDVQFKIKQSYIDQQRAEQDLTRFIQSENRSRRDAFIRLEETKQRIQLDFQRRANDFELRNLQEQFRRKEITETEFLSRLAIIKEDQATKEINFTNDQIDALRMKREEMIAINGENAESIALLGQIADLEGRIAEIRQTTQQELETAQQETEQSFLESAQRMVENFVQTILSGLIMGNLSIKDALMQLLNGIVNDITGRISKKINDFIFVGITKAFNAMKKFLTKDFVALEKMIGKFAGAIKSVFGGMASGLTSIFSGMGRFIIGIFKEIFSASKAVAMATALVTAHAMALNAAKEAANAPFPLNIILPPIVYASMLAFGLAKAAIIGSIGLVGFAEGTPGITEDMVAQFSKGEIVVPKTFSDGIRAGELSLSGGGAGAGGSSSGDITNIYFDGASFFGPPDEMVSQLERALIERKFTVGSRIALESA